MEKKLCLPSFINDETGAVTVDWVVLTAAIIGLGVAVAGSVGTGGTDLADDIQANLTGTEIASYLGPPTFGDVVAHMTYDPAPRVCQISMVMDEQGNITQTESCNTNVQADGSVITYEMSDGTQWTKTISNVTTYLEDTQNSPTTSESTTIWRNQDGEIVDAPEVS